MTRRIGWLATGWLATWSGIVGCHGPDAPAVPDEGTGIVGTGWANPFPNAQLLDATGHLDLRDLPATPSPLPLDRLDWRTGFSPSQVSVLRLDGIADDAFPSYQDITLGQGSVRMVDLTDGRDVPCFAELDAFPNADERALLVRPLEALRVGHRIGVAVTTAAVARPARFDWLLSDTPPASLEAVAPSYRALVDDLGVVGIAADDVAIAWEFPVGDGTVPLRSALDQQTVPSGHAFTRIRNLDAGDHVAPYTWRAAEGTFRAQQWLIDDRSLDLAPDGTVSPQGETDVYLYAHVPLSVKDAPAGSVPVLVFGHGIFGEPADYLDDPLDEGGLEQLADEAGFIVIATVWRGLSAGDRIVPIDVAVDFAKFHELTDLLVQGQTNTRTLIEAASTGDLLDDPVFAGASGQPLADRDHLYYYGISLGAIEGAVFLAQDPPVDAGALHVGGASWSTMLERSSNWAAFELLIGGAIDSAADRQVLYALSALWWDAVDPMAYTDALATRSFLLQESVNDEQVPNLTTEAFARSVGLPVLAPTDVAPYGIPAVDGPLPPGSRALVRFDPQLPAPDPANRPAAVTGAHGTPRGWPGARLQVIDFLTPGLEGQVVHHCGDAPCTADNPGVAR
ncbi:MAG: hypothetical protein ABMB14_17875 [Myxococcota bacterium]